MLYSPSDVNLSLCAFEWKRKLFMHSGEKVVGWCSLTSSPWTESPWQQAHTSAFALFWSKQELREIKKHSNQHTFFFPMGLCISAYIFKTLSQCFSAMLYGTYHTRRSCTLAYLILDVCRETIWEELDDLPKSFYMLLLSFWSYLCCNNWLIWGFAITVTT